MKEISKNHKRELEVVKNLVNHFNKILEKDESISDSDIIAISLHFITFILAGTPIKADDIIELLKREMPKRLEAYRKGRK